VPEKVYRLEVKVGGKWQRVCTIKAESHPEALRQAIACLPPEHFDKPIRLEQETGTGNPGPGDRPLGGSGAGP
jgi:hypothetical protein